MGETRPPVALFVSKHSVQYCTARQHPYPWLCSHESSETPFLPASFSPLSSLHPVLRFQSPFRNLLFSDVQFTIWTRQRSICAGGYRPCGWVCCSLWIRNTVCLPRQQVRRHDLSKMRPFDGSGDPLFLVVCVLTELALAQRACHVSLTAIIRTLVHFVMNSFS